MHRDKSSKKILLALNTLCEDTFTCCECQQTATHTSPKVHRGYRTQKIPGVRQRSKSHTNLREKQPFGIMETNIYDRIEYYKQNHKAALQEKQKANRLIQLQNECKNIKNKPDINQKSKLLYQKRRQERRLSPNVFDRLRIDEQERSKEKIVKTIHRIKQVTPSKVLNQYDLQSFASPKEIKMLKNMIFKIEI